MEVPRASPNQEPLCSISPSSLVINEIITVVTAIRKTTRWRNSGVASILGVSTLKDEFLADGLESRWKTNGEKSSSIRYPLVMEFSQLKEDLTNRASLNGYDSLKLLSPFLRTIKSPRMTGYITSLCLSAILKFFSFRIISEESPNLALSMRNLSFAITQCRFESFDASQDEAVLLRVSRLMEELLRGPGKAVLSDDSICEIVETGLSMCCQSRLSQVLRYSAELSMTSILEKIFERLKYIDVKTDSEDFWDASEEHSIKGEEFHYKKITEGDEISNEIDPFGIGSIREVFRVLVSFIDFGKQKFSDNIKAMALRFINTALEVSGSHISDFPSLRVLITDTLCKSLLQLIRSDHTALLTNSLLVMTTLLQAMPGSLKLQQELFISYLISCLHIPSTTPRERNVETSLHKVVSSLDLSEEISPDRATPTSFTERKRFAFDTRNRPPEVRELIVECLGSLSRIPYFLIDLYVNYDCDPQMSDLAIDLLKVLTRNCLVDSARYSTANVPPLCLDALLNFIYYFHEHLQPCYNDPNNTFKDDVAKTLIESKKRKAIIIEGAELFNESPSDGIAFLTQHSIIKQSDNPTCIVEFFHSTNRLSKRVLGEFLTKGSNSHILNAFISAFDFKGKRIDEALRLLLQSFRLPGESQLIERVLETFSHYYMSANPDSMSSKDAAFVLSYSIIMLNTDQHNPNIKSQRRMTLDDFCRNVRGVNDGQDFDRNFLSEIYKAIKENEIIVAEEHDTELSFLYIWSKLQQSVKITEPFKRSSSNVHDKIVFLEVWKSIMAALIYVFSTATEDTVFYRVVNGIQQATEVAAAYELNEPVDYAIERFCQFTALDPSSVPGTQLNTAIKVEDRIITVSELSVRFGRDFRAQLALLVLFWISSKFGNIIDASWPLLVQLTICLARNNLIDNSFLPGFKLFGYQWFPFPEPPLNSGKPALSKEGGLLSALSSYLSSYANDEPPCPTDEEIQHTLCTIDCISSAKIDNFLTKLVDLKQPGLNKLLDSLLSLSNPSTSLLTDENTVDDNKVSSVEALSNIQSAIVADLLTSLFLGTRESLNKLERRTQILSYLLFQIEQSGDEKVINQLSLYIFEMFMDDDLKLSENSEDWGLFSKLCNLLNDKNIVVRNQSLSLFHQLVNKYPFLLESWIGLQLVQSAVNTNTADIDDLYRLLSKIPTNLLDLPMFQVYLGCVDTLIQTIVKQIAQILSKQKKGASKGLPFDKSILDNHSAELNDAFNLFLKAAVEYKVDSNESSEHFQDTRWKIIYDHVCKLCLSRSRSLRAASLSCLQRIVVEQLDQPHEVSYTMALFHLVLLPTMENMITVLTEKPEHKIFGLAQAQMFNIICKTVLIDMNVLSAQKEMLHTLWLKLMDVAIKLSSIHGSESMAEVMESIKNVFMILHGAGALAGPTIEVDPEIPDHLIKTWNTTWNNLFIYYPELSNDLNINNEAEMKKENLKNPSQTTTV
ncbi:ArfGEF [Schizosaccharomyces pombe]|uniref:Uncharacterized protein C211.03 n=1 Tax=Schizosaccharomyces pombe (strain 972 / ATCC 24843) TaxID=284812 RepID=YHV3_SCHPO|nr:putative guanyl-nucleotide exchange factor [Schizosaccharomyces pombe]Q9P7R8.1 RecName: Full=Uncharacterized protein C211.03 [Schizosaccharomyces pombe 972h-]CAB75411.1 guanyl-nucleotide exchange factor (predicted) [Schizosaccharomyces pombe]|eukprot:NP_596613.1 putative guanyl-nucleotide exchange factor [Schizosaccharomyces pombe]